MTSEIGDIANKPSKVVHFNRLKRATVKPRVHKLFENRLETSSSSAKEADLSDYTPVHRQLEKLINPKIYFIQLRLIFNNVDLTSYVGKCAREGYKHWEVSVLLRSEYVWTGTHKQALSSPRV